MYPKDKNKRERNTTIFYENNQKEAVMPKIYYVWICFPDTPIGPTLGTFILGLIFTSLRNIHGKDRIFFNYPINEYKTGVRNSWRKCFPANGSSLMTPSIVNGRNIRWYRRCVYTCWSIVCTSFNRIRQIMYAVAFLPTLDLMETDSLGSDGPAPLNPGFVSKND